MHRSTKVSFLLIAICLSVSVFAPSKSAARSLSGSAQPEQRRAAAKKDYFTEDELDLIRNAQELGERVQIDIKPSRQSLLFLDPK